MIGNVTSDIVVALLVLGVIIVIHELGHFLVAKFFNIKVEVFSVGFGPRLLGFRRGETDYRISAFPLGGYVKMAGENPTDTVTGDPREFLSKPKWQRFLVAVAGPLMNLILAVVLLAGLYMYGSEVPEFLNNQAVIGIVRPDSPAARSGLRPGDLIVAFDGRQSPNWQDVEARVLTNPNRPLPITVERGGQRLDFVVTPIPEGPSETGFSGMGPHIRVIVRGVHAGSPAEAAGLRVGDEIVQVNGIDLKTSGISIQETIQKISEPTFPLTVIRDGQPVEVQVTPVVQNGNRMIGIDIPPPTVMIKLGFAAALDRSIETNSDNAALIFQVLGKLFKREASLKQLDGPIGIVRVSGQMFEAGIGPLIQLVALISLNLGLLNLLPIPILDGGVMLLLVIESIMGRDLSLAMKERIVQVSFVFLLMLTVFVLYNDVVKLLPPAQPGP
jgi:regulator of sigma E protease